MLCIRQGLIHTAVNPVPFVGDILVREGKLAAIAPHVEAAGCKELDATGLNIYPGFIDAHCHVGLDVFGGGPNGMEFNETNDPVTPQLRAIDGFNPFDHHLDLAREGGITCIATGAGSANVVGGNFICVKTYGKQVDSMVVKESIAIKCALGENPKVFYKTKGVASRMTTAALLRTLLERARRYMAKVDRAAGNPDKLPAYDPKLEAMLPVLRHEIPLKCHAHQANDILTAIRIAKEFGVGLTLEHVTDGLKIADELAKENVMLAVGPFFCSGSKREFAGVDARTPGALAKAGCHVCLISDAPVVPLQGLPLYAGMAIQNGMDPFQALQAITINGAEHIGVQDRVGSLEVGKDADLVISEGSPLNLAGRIRYVFIDGQMKVRK